MSQKKHSSLIDYNFHTNEAIITRITPLDRGKTDLDSDILELYTAEKFTKIIMFKLDCTFSDVSKSAKIGISNISRVFLSLTTHQANLCFDKLSLEFINNITWI